MSLAPIAVREDLSLRDPRERISKSFVQQAANCGQKAWLSIHDPRPWTPPEKVTFGSAVDAGVEIVIRYLRSGQQPDMSRALGAAMERVASETNAPDRDEVWAALDAFYSWDVVRAMDWSRAITQHHIRLELQGIGEVDAHPDLILRDDGSVDHIIDVKTAKAAKPKDAAATSYTELGFYALLRETETGIDVGSVGYWTWVRTTRPWWQAVSAPVTDHMLRVARHRVAAVARAIEADTLLNDGAAVPVNSVFTAPPRYGCGDCQYQPDCTWAEEVIDAAA